MDSAKKPLTVLSLCTGYGGIERGLELAGEQLEVLAAVEVEAFAAALLVSKMEEGALGACPIWTDVKSLPVEPFRDRVDLITGGYPCQPFSAAGKRAGTDDPRHLWPYIRDIIESVRPIRCFFENVEGHISLGLREVISDLESLGYRTAFGIFSATEVGAHHQRKRVYILADSQNDGSRRTIRTVQGKNASVREPKEYWESAPKQPNDAGQDEGTELADSSSEGLSERDGSRASTKRQPFAESECGGGVRDELADSQSLRIQGLRPSGQQEPSPHGKEELLVRESKGREQTRWDAEPNVGRVVDGCANRVDRIRLLGNGVVPQTAAKAWRVLNDELSN